MSFAIVSARRVMSWFMSEGSGVGKANDFGGSVCLFLLEMLMKQGEQCNKMG